MKKNKTNIILILLLSAPVFSLLILFKSHSISKPRISLHILGSGGPEANDERASASYLIRINGKESILVDFGSGAPLNFEKIKGKVEDLDLILFTHFHTDHSSGFPFLIKAAYFSARKKDLMVFGPDANSLTPSTEDFAAAFFSRKNSAYYYLHEYINPEINSDFKIRPASVHIDEKKIWSKKINSLVNISAVRVHHGPIAALAWRIDIGRYSLTFSGDTSNRLQNVAKLAKNTDLFIAHHAIAEQSGSIARNLHMPPSVIGKIAAKAKVKKLILSHRMLRTIGKEKESEKIIRNYYQGPLIFANDLDRFILP